MGGNISTRFEPVIWNNNPVQASWWSGVTTPVEPIQIPLAWRSGCRSVSRESPSAIESMMSPIAPSRSGTRGSREFRHETFDDHRLIAPNQFVEVLILRADSSAPLMKAPGPSE